MVLVLNAILPHVLTDAGPFLRDRLLVLGLDSNFNCDDRELHLIDIAVLNSGDVGLETVEAIRKSGACRFVAGDALPLLVDVAPASAFLQQCQ